MPIASGYHGHLPRDQVHISTPYATPLCYPLMLSPMLLYDAIPVTLLTSTHLRNYLLHSNVTNISPLFLTPPTAISRASLRAMAGVISTQLHDAGFNGAEVEQADAQVDTMQVVSHYEIVEYTQDLTGVSAIEAKSDSFKDSFKKSIAAQFGGYRMMDADNIDIVSVTIDAR